MKKNLIVTAIVLITSVISLAQSPEKMSFQAVIRDAGNNLVISQTVGMQISILQGSAGGSAVYIETHSPTTNSYGLVSIEIGGGTVVSGAFSTIDWGNGPYFFKTEADPTGGTTYTISGTSQLLSVPFAQYAKTTESLSGGITETQNVADVLAQDNDGNTIQIKNLADPSDNQDAVTKTFLEKRVQGYLISSDIEEIDSRYFSVYSAGGDDYDYGRGITTDADRNVFVTGWYIDDAIFGSTTLEAVAYDNAFLAKYDPSGNLIWVRMVEESGHCVSRSITADASGNVYATGVYEGNGIFGSVTLNAVGGSSDVFVAKYDASGNVLWAKSAGGSGSDEGMDITIDGLGNVTVTGYYSGTATFGSSTLISAGNDDIFIAKFDDSGNQLWVKSAGGTSEDQGQSVTTDASDNVYITGTFQGSCSFGPSSLTSAGGKDIFLAKYDGSGNVVWIKSAGGTFYDYAYGVSTDAPGNVFITGAYAGTATFGSTSKTAVGLTDIYIAKYDNSGNFLWVNSDGGSSYDYSYDISNDDSGNVFVTGKYEGTIDFESLSLTSSGDYDIFMAQYDDSGNFMWAKSGGGSSYDVGSAMVVDNSDNVYITGEYADVASFGSASLTSEGYSDVFIWKYINDHNTYSGFTPTVTSIATTSIIDVSAESGGNITSNGGTPVSARGACWSASPYPTIADNKTTDGTGTGSYSSSLSGLTSGTTYYVRAYATNDVGTSYGDIESFTTEQSTFTDSRDSKVYEYVTIGTQTWMAENLAYLPSVYPSSDGSLSYPRCYVHSYEGTNVSAAKAEANYGTYGVLYNWTMADIACPTGWHLPSDEEWKTLEKYLGMSVADADADGWRSSGEVGAQLKATGWDNDVNANNSSDFSALPGGYRDIGSFYYTGEWAYFWTSSPAGGASSDVSSRWFFSMRRDVGRYDYSRQKGYSIRCLQD